MSEISDAHVEKMARAMLLLGGGDPDLMVFPGAPAVYGTPKGEVHGVSAVPAVPMWTLYTGSARKALEIASEVRKDGEYEQLDAVLAGHE